METKQLYHSIAITIIVASLFFASLAITLNQTNTKIANLQSTLAAQDTQIDLYTQRLSNQSAQIAELNQTLATQHTLLDEYNQLINSLQQQSAQDFTNLTDQITQSFTRLGDQLENLTDHLPIEQYDYIIYCVNDTLPLYGAKNGQTGAIDFTSNDTAQVINYAFEHGNSVFVKSGGYLLNSDVILQDKSNALLDSEFAILRCKNHQIIINGTTYLLSQNNRVSGFVIYNGGIRIENSARTTISNMLFQTCTVGIELVNTNTWTECTKIDDAHFIMCTEGIVFRTPAPGATGSYGNAAISRCYFNLRDNSAAIVIEPDAGFTDGQMQNVRIWVGGYTAQQYNQTGLKVSGSLFQTVMESVVFESFGSGNLSDAKIYAVNIDTDYATPILQQGVTFLGSWTAQIYNPFNSETQGEGATVTFKQENITVPVGTSNQYADQSGTIQIAPATISSFKALIMVGGNFSQNETLTVRIHLGFVDKTSAAGAQTVEKTFASSGSLWLTDDDMLKLLPLKDVIKAVFIEAKTDCNVTGVSVQVSAFGETAWSAM
jgi:cell division protein FtsL